MDDKVLNVKGVPVVVLLDSFIQIFIFISGCCFYLAWLCLYIKKLSLK